MSFFEVLVTPYLIIEENKRICFIFSMLLTAKAVTPGISYHVTQRRDKRPSRMELLLDQELKPHKLGPKKKDK